MILCKPTGKRIISMVLCVLMLLSPLASLVDVYAADETPTAMQATTVAAPTSTAPTAATVTIVDDEEGAPFWGITSVATATVGDPIEGLIEERSSVILDSTVNEGYANQKTSNYFRVNTGWNEFNMKTQDLMFYLELPAGVSEIRLRGFTVSANNAYKWPAPAGMTYKYLASDSNTWVEGTVSTDGNKTMALTPGFKGYIRVAVNTAANCADYAESVIKMVNFDLKIASYGGSVGAAKLGGVWFVSKEDALLATVNGGTEQKKLTSAELPSRAPDPEQATWTGSVMTGTTALSETAAVGETPTSVKWEALWNSSTTPTLTVGEPIAPIGTQKSVIIDSPKQEGYTSGVKDDAGNPVNTQTAFRPQINRDINPTTQDIMFYIELPTGSKSVRINDINCNWNNTWPAPGGMTYQYLPVNGTTWTTGTISTDGSKQIDLTDGFKGYVRLVLNSATNYDAVVTGDLTTKLRVHYFTLRLEKFGLNNGQVKFGGVWFVTKEDDTYYIKLDDATEKVSMSGYQAPNYTVGTAAFNETATVGEASAITTWSNPGWGGVVATPTMTVGETVNILNDGQKSLVIDSEKHEGYHIDMSERSHAKFDVAMGNREFNMATQELMFYVELPATAESIRLYNVKFTLDGGTLSPYTSNMTYRYLPLDGNEWVDGGILGSENQQITLTAGFKGYVRVALTDATGWWWQYHGDSGVNAAWKTQTAKMTDIIFAVAKFGGDLGAFKLGGVWFVSKDAFTTMKVGDAETNVRMTTWLKPVAVMNATSVNKEPDGAPIWNANLSISNGEWLTDEQTEYMTSATASVTDAITKIDTCKSIAVNSTKKEGWNAEGQSTYPVFQWRAYSSAKIDMSTQDLMFYVKLAPTASSMRIKGITVDDWNISFNGGGMTYKSLSIDSDEWVTGTISDDGNYTVELGEGFEGYVRLVMSTATDSPWVATGHDSTGWKTKEISLNSMSFWMSRFGGDYGEFRLGGMWTVSGEDSYMVSVNGGTAVKMTDAEVVTPSSSSSGEETPEPTEPSSSSSGEETPEPDERDYLLGTLPNMEYNAVGETSGMVTFEDKHDSGYNRWGYSSATATVGEHIATIGTTEPKATVFSSDKTEGFLGENTAAFFTVGTAWKSFDIANQDLMFYIELPSTGEGYSSIRMSGITMNSWSTFPGCTGMSFQYLAIDGTGWVSGVADSNKELRLPNGFKGYIRLIVNSAPECYGSNNVDWQTKTLPMQDFGFQIGRFGGEYGDAKLGGFWFVSKEAFTKIKVDDGEVENLLKSGSTQPTEPSSSSGEETPEPTEPSSSSSSEEIPEPTEPSDRDYLVASRPSYEQGTIGESATQIKVSEDQKWWKIDTKAVTTAAENITIIDDRKSAVISSTIHEGYAYSRTSPLFEVTTSWQNFNMAEQDLMFYIELPVSGKGKSSIRMGGIGMDSWSKWPGVYSGGVGMEYAYLELNGTEWVSGKADANKQLDFPDGFKGYVRLKINTAKNAIDGGWDKGTYAMQYFTFNICCFGGDYGDAKFGGVWFVSKENYTKIKIGNAEVMNMTKTAGDRDYLLGSIPNMESGTAGSVSGIVTVDDKGWWGKTSATVSVAEHIAPIGTKAQKTTVFSSDKVEGYLNSASAPCFSVGTSWTTFDMGKQDLMFYIELPATGMGYSSIRMSGITMNSWGFYPSVVGMTYQYLEANGNKWVTGTADSNKEIKLPEGFKGYIRLVLNTAGSTYIPDNKPALADWKTAVLPMQDFSFFIGAFGGKFGDAKLGGVWFVSKEDYTTISVSGGDVESLTRYTELNESALARFRELIESLDEKNLGAAAIVDEANTLYSSMADEYKAKVTAQELAKLKEYEDALAVYRPTFLGVAMKKSGSKPQGLKVGYTVNEALIAKEGYKVVASGAVILASSSYDGSSVIDKESANALVAQGRTCTDGYCAASDIEDLGYRDTYLVRVYVVYEKIGGDGTQFTVWNGNYTDRSGNTAPYMSCYMTDVSSYFFVPLMKKIEG